MALKTSSHSSRQGQRMRRRWDSTVTPMTTVQAVKSAGFAYEPAKVNVVVVAALEADTLKTIQWARRQWRRKTKGRRRRPGWIRRKGTRDSHDMSRAASAGET